MFIPPQLQGTLSFFTRLMNCQDSQRSIGKPAIGHRIFWLFFTLYCKLWPCDWGAVFFLKTNCWDSWSCAMPPRIHLIMMDIIARVNLNPGLDWVSLDPVTAQSIGPTLEYWLHRACKRHSTESITSSAGYLFLVSLNTIFSYWNYLHPIVSRVGHTGWLPYKRWTYPRTRFNKCTIGS